MIFVLHRIDPDENMQRYYIVTVQKSLFGEMSVVTMWGSLETGAQQRQVFSAETFPLAVEKAEKIVETKIGRGYWLVPLDAQTD
jgi:predicted DNA-binding WGR domain protein